MSLKPVPDLPKLKREKCTAPHIMLRLPESLYIEVLKMAHRRDMKVAVMARRLVKLGLMVEEQRDEFARSIVHEHERESNKMEDFDE